MCDDVGVQLAAASFTANLPLLSNDPIPNDAIVDTKLPLSLNVADFSYYAGGSFTFGDARSFGRFDLNLTKITIKEVANVPEPSGLVLMLVSMLALFLANSFKRPGKSPGLAS